MGLRRALLIGINAYPGNPLRGCLDDVLTMERISHLYGVTAIRFLRDEEATKAAILDGLDWLIHSTPLAQGETALMAYSGHGTWVRDLNGDEPDHRDESLVPIDFSFNDQSTWLTDDEFGKFLRKHPLPSRTSLTISLDCCNSGTMMRFVGPAGASMSVRSLPAPAEIMRGATRGWARWIGLGRVRERRFGERLLPWKAPVASEGCVGILSATRPAQLAADAYIAGHWQGAHTAALAEALAGSPSTLGAMLEDMRAWLRRNGFGGPNGQTPQFQGHGRMLKLPFLAPPTRSLT